MLFADVMNIQALAEWFRLQNLKDDPKAVLVVEDDVLLRPVVARTLSAIDTKLDLIWATSGQEALDVIRSRELSLVIADCLLGPGQNGLDLWKECKKAHPQTPFLMISGLGPKTLAGLRPPGIEGLPELVEKPLHMQELRDRIQTLLKEDVIL